MSDDHVSSQSSGKDTRKGNAAKQPSSASDAEAKRNVKNLKLLQQHVSVPV